MSQVFAEAFRRFYRDQGNRTLYGSPQTGVWLPTSDLVRRMNARLAPQSGQVSKSLFSRVKTGEQLPLPSYLQAFCAVLRLSEAEQFSLNYAYICEVAGRDSVVDATLSLLIEQMESDQVEVGDSFLRLVRLLRKMGQPQLAIQWAEQAQRTIYTHIRRALRPSHQAHLRAIDTRLAYEQGQAFREFAPRDKVVAYTASLLTRMEDGCASQPHLGVLADFSQGDAGYLARHWEPVLRYLPRAAHAHYPQDPDIGVHAHRELALTYAALGEVALFVRQKSALCQLLDQGITGELAYAALDGMVRGHIKLRQEAAAVQLWAEALRYSPQTAGGLPVPFRTLQHARTQAELLVRFAATHDPLIAPTIRQA